MRLRLTHLVVVIGLAASSSSALALPAVKKTPVVSAAVEQSQDRGLLVGNAAAPRQGARDEQTPLLKRDTGEASESSPADLAKRSNPPAPPAPEGNPGSGSESRQHTRPRRSSLPYAQFIETFDEDEKEFLHICVTSQIASYRFRGNKGDPRPEILQRWHDACVEHIRERVRIQERYWGDDDEETDPGFPWYNFSRWAGSSSAGTSSHLAPPPVVVDRNRNTPATVDQERESSPRRRLLEFGGRVGRALHEGGKAARVGVGPSTLARPPVFAVP